MSEKINDSAGFSDMVAAAPKTEFDELARTVGALSSNLGEMSVEIDELKRRPSNEASMTQTLLGLHQRIKAVEDYLNKQAQDNSVQRDMMERTTRHSAMDLAVKACPQVTGFDVLHDVYKGILQILTGAPG